MITQIDDNGLVVTVSLERHSCAIQSYRGRLQRLSVAAVLFHSAEASTQRPTLQVEHAALFSSASIVHPIAALTWRDDEAEIGAL